MTSSSSHYTKIYRRTELVTRSYRIKIKNRQIGPLFLSTKNDSSLLEVVSRRRRRDQIRKFAKSHSTRTRLRTMPISWYYKYLDARGEFQATNATRQRKDGVHIKFRLE